MWMWILMHLSVFARTKETEPGAGRGMGEEKVLAFDHFFIILEDGL